MSQRPRGFKRTDTLFPYTTLFRSPLGALSGRPPPRAFKRLRRSTVKRDAGMIENDDEAFADNYAERDQAKALREQARAGGLRFEAYLPGDMADWLLAQVERGHFVDPSERSEEHTSELQSLMRISYAVFCLKKKTQNDHSASLT